MLRSQYICDLQVTLLACDPFADGTSLDAGLCQFPHNILAEVVVDKAANDLMSRSQGRCIHVQLRLHNAD